MNEPSQPFYIYKCLNNNQLNKSKNPNFCTAIYEKQKKIYSFHQSVMIRDSDSESLSKQGKEFDMSFVLRLGRLDDS